MNANHQSIAANAKSEGQSTPSNYYQVITIKSSKNHFGRRNRKPKEREVRSQGRKSKGDRSGDGYLAAFLLLELRDKNAENTIGHRGFDVILVDTSWEGEAAREFPTAALRDPVFGFLLGLSGLFLRGGDLSGSFSTFLLDGCLVRSLMAVLAFGDGSLGRRILDEASWWSAGGVAALGAAPDGQGVGISEFDLDVLLFNAREFAVEFVGILDFLDIELRGKGLQLREAGAVALAAVLIEFVQHTEEGLEGDRGVG